MVTRFCWWRLALAISCCLLPSACLCGGAPDEPRFLLETDKQTYLVGEPVLIRATLQNEADEPYAVGRFRAMRRAGNLGHVGFAVTVANKDGDLGDIFNRVEGSPHSNAPTHDESLVDRYAFPEQVAAGQTLYRLDVCAFAKPGTYSLKAVLAAEESRRIETNEVTVKVVPIDESSDPIVRILSEEQLVSFGYSVVDTFYLDGHVVGSGVSLGWEKLRPILRAMLEHGQESVLYPYARYVWFLRNRDWMRGGGTARHPLATTQAVGRATSFLNDYPDSWLTPDVMRLLFFTYLANKQPQKALAIGREALALDPVPAVVLSMRIGDHVKELEAAVGDGATLTLQTNKQTYLVGEPVLVRTTLRNEADEPYAVGRFRGMMFGGGGPYAHLGFSVEVRRGEETLGSIFEPSRDAPLGAAPRHHEGICDRGIFPREIGAGQTVYRVDVCCLEEPGSYQLSAFLAGEEGRRIDSEPVEIKVLALDESDDPITGLVDPDRIVAFGRSLVVVYYLDGEVINYGGAMKPDELAPIIQAVLARGRQSVFCEHVRYIWLLCQRDERRSVRSRIALATQEAIDAAEAFLKDYPDSWLVPDVMRLLFFTHLANKQTEKALKVGKELLAFDPVPAVVPGLHIPERIDELSSSIVVDQAMNTATGSGH